MMRRPADKTVIGKVAVSCYTVPTDAPEADGTFDWESTTLVLVEISAGDCTGLGYTYAHAAVAQIIHGALAKVVERRDAFDVPGAHAAMLREVRNLGRAGNLRERDCRRGQRAVGSQGTAIRRLVAQPAWRGARPGAGLRQRRVHIVFRRATARATRRLGRRTD